MSANAYIGAETVAQALAAGAQIVVGGRLADPSLTVGPAMAHFGWRADDWDRLGRATMVGHLLECGAQVSGGYSRTRGSRTFRAWRGWAIRSRRSPTTAQRSSPSRTVVAADVDAHTVKEQLLYEIKAANPPHSALPAF